MQNYYDTVTKQNYAFEDDVVVTGTPGALVFTAAHGAVLGPYPSTLVPGTYTPPPVTPPPPTLQQLAGAALNAGVTISLSGSITLAPTLFPCDTATTNKIGSVVDIFNKTGAFPGGATTYDMKDMANPPVWHTFTGAQYETVVLAISTYVAPLYLILDGHPGTTTLPDPVIPTIAV